MEFRFLQEQSRQAVENIRQYVWKAPPKCRDSSGGLKARLTPARPAARSRYFASLRSAQNDAPPEEPRAKEVLSVLSYEL